MTAPNNLIYNGISATKKYIIENNVPIIDNQKIKCFRIFFKVMTPSQKMRLIILVRSTSRRNFNYPFFHFNIYPLNNGVNHIAKYEQLSNFS